MAHVIDYVELAVDDLEAGKAFYANALGWAFTDYGPEYAGMQDPTRPGQEFGGMYARPSAGRGDGGVLALVRTDDADAALTSVLAAGGQSRRSYTTIPAGGASPSPTPRGTSWVCTSPPSNARSIEASVARGGTARSEREGDCVVQRHRRAD